MANAATRPLTFDEYLALEDQAVDVKHEFVGGRMFAMTGGSLRHNRAMTNLLAALDAAVETDDCRLYAADAKLRIGDNAYYPDVMVVCTEEAPSEQFETSPCLVAEVLSPSTRTVDLREKLDSYRRSPSLKAYLVVDTDRLTVECHVLGDGWLTVTLSKAGDQVELTCPFTTLRWDQVFRRFPELR